MPRESVRVSRIIAGLPDQLWQHVRDFSSKWHPAIARITEERDGHGSRIRTFTVSGEDTLYRERLTYYSETDRSYRYEHLQGIEGVDSYQASLRVSSDEAGDTILTMEAEIESDQPRLSEISSGTRTVFEMGLEALAARFHGGLIKELIVDGEPKLSVFVSGTGPGPLCLFLHGIGGAKSNWIKQLEATAPVMHSAATDLRGYGDSDLGPNQSTIEDYCADILRVREELGAKKLILCGLSYGAWIATSFAVRHPEMLAGLILSGGCTGMSEASTEERAGFRESREVPLDAGKAPKDFAADVVNVIAGPDATSHMRQDLLASMSAIPAATYRDALRCFTNPPEQFDFSKLTMPVLMMTGAYDRLAPPDEIRGVAERIWQQSPTRDVQFEVIEGSGHVCNLEAPEAYNALLTSFLTKCIR